MYSPYAHIRKGANMSTSKPSVKLGEPIEAFFVRMVGHAKTTGAAFVAKHNDLHFFVRPTDNPVDLSDAWWRKYGGRIG